MKTAKKKMLLDDEQEAMTLELSGEQAAAVLCGLAHVIRYVRGADTSWRRSSAEKRIKADLAPLIALVDKLADEGDALSADFDAKLNYLYEIYGLSSEC